MPRALPVSHGTLRGTFRAGLGAGGGRWPASSLQGSSHCPPEWAPPWTKNIAQWPQLPSQAGGRGGQAASCVLQALNPPAPQTLPAELALWALRGARQAALTVSWLPGLQPPPPPGCHWPSPQTPELGQAQALALCLGWPWGDGGPIFTPMKGTVSARCHRELGRHGPGSLPGADSQSLHSAVALVQCRWGPGGLGAFDSGRSPQSHAER